MTSCSGTDLEYTGEAQCGAARAGRLRVRGRELLTPAFLPVGTYGSVKGMAPHELSELGAGMLLANACHLHDRPGEHTVAELGGLHRFMGWDGALLTDSGGFQVFSMLDIAELDDQGVSFRSPLDGRKLRLGPVEAADIQLALDSDIAMVFDHCPPLPASRDLLELSVRRTTDWARRAQAHHARHNPRGQAQFAIVQGGLDDELRARSAAELIELDFPGYAVGGLSVGESRAELALAMTRYAPLLPEHKLRYVMGIGGPADLLAAIAAGFDVFDCVLPSRNGRHGTLFVPGGNIHLKNSRFRADREPIEAGCDCPACAGGWSRGVLRHLIKAGEPLGRRLCTAHNLRFLHRLVARAREAVVAQRFDAFLADERAVYTKG
ncbi:MAG: queuine tRNA-ribosyltransferase [Planctomycetota bacterium]|nr:MAG: queuine tRNA-ribosyltransferase [Planctomycetota bacterium]